jgi:hypothetical protein
MRTHSWSFVYFNSAGKFIVFNLCGTKIREV